MVAICGDSAFGFSGMELETICRYKLPVVTVIVNNSGIYRGDANGGEPSPTAFLNDALASGNPRSSTLSSIPGWGPRAATSRRRERTPDSQR